MFPTQVPNAVLDLHTLRFVRRAIENERRLCRGSFLRPRKFFGFTVGHDRCALGCAYMVGPENPHPDPIEICEFMKKLDLDPLTLARIVNMNDIGLMEVSPSIRAAAMRDWLDRCIAYAENVKREIEGKAASYNVRTQIAVDKAEAA